MSTSLRTPSSEAVLEVCPDVPAAQVIGEPVGRDTAAAVGLAAVLVQERSAIGTFAILPADHVIHDVVGFQKTLELGFRGCRKGRFSGHYRNRAGRACHGLWIYSAR